MRIIGGRHRGRRLRVPAGLGVRPTADRVREAVFNILEHGIEWDGLAGASVLDAFAGSGALGLEALSRGAVHATFLDHDPVALESVRENAAALGCRGQASVLRLDATRPPPPPRAARAPCRLVFLDPPYGSAVQAPALAALLAKGWIADQALCVVESAAKEPFAAPEGFTAVDERTYGAARVSFLGRRP